MSAAKHSSEWNRREWAKVIIGLIFVRDVRKGVGLAIDQWVDTPEPLTEPPTVDPEWFSRHRNCEEGDIVCVDPWPCVVHDRTASTRAVPEEEK